MNLRSPNVEIPTMDRYWAEQIVAFMILEKYLKEDFHFTAYSTISYIRKGPNVPKKEDDILFHGARVLKLPEKDLVWDSTSTYTETSTDGNETPKSKAKTQPEKRRQNSTGRKQSVKKTKIVSSTTTSSTKSSSKATSSRTSQISPKKLNMDIESPQAASTSKKSQELTTNAVVMDTTKRLSLLERENIIKINKSEIALPNSMDDVIFIPEEENVIEID